MNASPTEAELIRFAGVCFFPPRFVDDLATFQLVLIMQKLRILLISVRSFVFLSYRGKFCFKNYMCCGVIFWSAHIFLEFRDAQEDNRIR